MIHDNTYDGIRARHKSMNFSLIVAGISVLSRNLNETIKITYLAKFFALVVWQQSSKALKSRIYALHPTPLI